MSLCLCAAEQLNGGAWHWRPVADTGSPRYAGGFVVGNISLSNSSPNSGVIIEGNSHSPGFDSCPGKQFAATFAAGATGLRSEASICQGCHHPYPDRVCVAVATGRAPDANSSVDQFQISLNTGDFETQLR